MDATLNSKSPSCSSLDDFSGEGVSFIAVNEPVTSMNYSKHGNNNFVLRAIVFISTYKSGINFWYSARMSVCGVAAKRCIVKS